MRTLINTTFVAEKSLEKTLTAWLEKAFLPPLRQCAEAETGTVLELRILAETEVVPEDECRYAVQSIFSLGPDAAFEAYRKAVGDALTRLRHGMGQRILPFTTAMEVIE